jgi:ribonuclease P protein component
MEQSLGKEYKLCHKQQIDALFSSGSAQKQYPLIARYQVQDLTSRTSFQIVISAPKRTFKTAVQRNRIKRICKEAVRKNKSELETWLKEHNQQLGIFLLYTGKEEILPSKLEQKTQNLFQKIIDDLQQNYA